MRRWIAVLWHASFLLLAGVLYFFFVLPRWFELIGAWPVGLGLAMRIVTGALIGLAALPVVFTLLRTRKPEFGTPQLALSLRFWSIVLHVLAGALIVGAAVSEIWVSLDRAGQVLFGIYGAAAAVAVLGALAFYLAFAAELPPPAPKPLKPRKQTRRRGRGAADTDAAAEDNEAAEDADTTESAEAEPSDAGTEATEDAEQDATHDEVPAPVTADESAPTTETAEPVEAEDTHVVSGNGTGNAENPDADERGSTLRNRRPSGKSTSRLFGRSRRGVALDD
jgi:hypothetical protein